MKKSTIGLIIGLSAGICWGLKKRRPNEQDEAYFKQWSTSLISNCTNTKNGISKLKKQYNALISEQIPLANQTIQELKDSLGKYSIAIKPQIAKMENSIKQLKK